MFHRFLITQMPLFGFPFLGRSWGSLGEVFSKHFPSRNPFVHGLSERFREVGRSISKFHFSKIAFVAQSDCRRVSPLMTIFLLRTDHLVFHCLYAVTIDKIFWSRCTYIIGMNEHPKYVSDSITKQNLAVLASIILTTFPFSNLSS